MSICYYKNTPLEKAIDRLFVDVDRAYRDGTNILILSDRDIDEYHVAIPSLLAVSAVSKYLVRTKQAHRHGADSGKRRTPAMSIILPRFWASAPAPSTRIWRRRASAI